MKLHQEQTATFAERLVAFAAVEGIFWALILSRQSLVAQAQPYAGIDIFQRAGTRATKRLTQNSPARSTSTCRRSSATRKMIEIVHLGGRDRGAVRTRRLEGTASGNECRFDESVSTSNTWRIVFCCVWDGRRSTTASRTRSSSWICSVSPEKAAFLNAQQRLQEATAPESQAKGANGRGFVAVSTACAVGNQALFAGDQNDF